MSPNLLISSLDMPCDARQLFSHLSHQPWAMLLDSGHSQHIDARFDIIVHSPITTLTTCGDTTIINNIKACQQITSTDNPFDLIESQLADSALGVTDCELPFSGGAMGHFSYDLGRYCEHIDSHAKKDIDLPEMAIGIYDHGLIFDRNSHQVKLVSRSHQQRHQELLLDYLELAKLSAVTATNHIGAWTNQLTKQQYFEKFTQVQHNLRQGVCYQINLTQRFCAPHHGDEYQTYLKLAQENNSPFSAFIRLPNAAIVSVSPERFIQSRQGKIQTKPIKGTRARSSDTTQDAILAQELLASEKDQSENLMIVDLLRNDIGRCALPGSVKVPKLFALESFKNVHHLVSTIEAQLATGYSPITLLKHAFPGGSITGAPKISAMNVIDKLEPHRRSIYCGSIGYISCDNQMDTNITIRTLLCLDNTVYCWAGGGIVADSQAEAEYQECFDKVASILPILTDTQ